MARKRPVSQKLETYRILAAHNAKCGMPFTEATSKAAQQLPEALRYLNGKSDD